MAHTVYVFGAGASHSMGIPLLNGLVDEIHRLQRSAPDASAEDFRLVSEILRKHLTRLHSKSIQDLENIETVFNLVEMGRLIGRFPGVDAAEIEHLSQAIRNVLAETIEHTCRFQFNYEEGSWVPPKYYSALFKAHFPDHRIERGGVAVLTFNYDLAADFALFWNVIPYDYGLDNAPQPEQAVPLLKLHGSLNWVKRPESGLIQALGLEKIFIHSGRHRHSGVTVGDLRVPVRARLRQLLPLTPLDDVVPALVPPSWNKTQYHEAFKKIWQRAAAELSDAEEIYVIGYSYPQSDPFFHALLALGTEGETRIRRFVVVDPSKEVGDRFRSLLGPEIVRKFNHQQTTFEQWLLERVKELRSERRQPTA